MPIRKSGMQIVASQQLGAGQLLTSDAIDLRDKFGATLVAKLTNGATGPGTSPEVIIEVSIDAASWVEVSRIPTTTTANAETPLRLGVEAEVLYARIKIQNGDNQPITVQVDAHMIDTIG